MDAKDDRVKPYSTPLFLLEVRAGYSSCRCTHSMPTSIGMCGEVVGSTAVSAYTIRSVTPACGFEDVIFDTHTLDTCT